MLLMDYPSMRGEDLPDYAKNATWNILHTYIDVHSKILIDGYPGDGVQSILRLQFQCANMTFSEQRRYIRTFQQVIHKVGKSSINYIKRFQNSKALVISVVNSYSEDQLMQTFLDNL